MALARIARNGFQRSRGSTNRVTNMKSEESSFLNRSHSPLSESSTFFRQNITPRHPLPFPSNIGSRGVTTTPQYQYGRAQRAFEESVSDDESLKYPTLEATKAGEKPRVVVIGSGWAACRFLKGLDTKLYDVVCVSPRNHMVFTPLLASTCVGTLEFRSVVEPVSQIQTALAKDPNSYFFLASCTGLKMLLVIDQVAERQGKYLVELFNKLGKQDAGKASSARDVPLGDPFVYKHLGSMASVGRYKALVDLRESKDVKGISLAGFISWFIWRSAYLTRVISWRNRFYVAINWATTLVFGRDNSRI